jgi:sulfate adenylyltransferase subunit 2
MEQPIMSATTLAAPARASRIDHLDALEHRSVHLLREAYANFPQLAMLWSIGKDSTVLLWLARKAFFGHVPMPLVHIDTSYKIPEMIQYRDRLAAEWRLTVIYGQNEEALAAKQTFPDGNVDRLTCCGNLKTEALRRTLSGEGKRYRFDHKLGKYVVDTNREPYTGVIVGARADEEGSRSKERYFSPRSGENNWNIADQPPEFWNQYATEFAPGTHVRIHPLLDWTELDIWEYIERERIPTVALYYDQGKGERYRSLGCWPCTKAVTSDARNVQEIIVELKSGRFANIAERSGRAQDKDDGGGLESLRRDGYM